MEREEFRFRFQFDEARARSPPGVAERVSQTGAAMAGSPPIAQSRTGEDAASFANDAPKQGEDTKKYVHILAKIRDHLAVGVLVGVKKAREIDVWTAYDILILLLTACVTFSCKLYYTR